MGATSCHWFSSVGDVRDAAEACGSHFFHKDAMRFFKTRVLEGVYTDGDAVWFITSDRAPGGPRRYSVRSFAFERNQDGSGIAEIGTVAVLDTARDARKFATMLAEGVPAGLAQTHIDHNLPRTGFGRVEAVLIWKGRSEAA